MITMILNFCIRSSIYYYYSRLIVVIQNMFLTAPPSCTVCSAKREWTAKMVRLGAGDKGNTIQQIIFKSAKDNPTDMINITSTFFLLIHEHS